MKLFGYKKRIKELENELTSEIEKRKYYQESYECEKQFRNAREEENQKYDKIVQRKDEEIEELKRKIDMLYAYYDMDKEATQEIKTKMRIDMRVHELEMEKLDLKNQVRSYNDVILNSLRLGVQAMQYSQIPYSQMNYNLMCNSINPYRY